MSKETIFLAAIPVLIARDLTTTRHFYERLGFALICQQSDYLMMQGHGVEVRFRRPDRRQNGWRHQVSVQVRKLPIFQNVNQPLMIIDASGDVCLQPYHMNEFAFIAPTENYTMWCEPA